MKKVVQTQPCLEAELLISGVLLNISPGSIFRIPLHNIWLSLGVYFG